MVEKLSGGLAGNAGLASMAEGHALGDAVGVCGVHHGGLAKGAAAFGRLGLSQMANARVTTQDLAGGRDLKPLGRGLLRFDTFWATHNKNLNSVAKEQELYVARAGMASAIFLFLLVAEIGMTVGGVERRWWAFLGG
jgi:hypothetical protein